MTQYKHTEGNVIAYKMAAWFLNASLEAAAEDGIPAIQVIKAYRELVNNIPAAMLADIEAGNGSVTFQAMTNEEAIETMQPAGEA